MSSQCHTAQKMNEGTKEEPTRLQVPLNILKLFRSFCWSTRKNMTIGLLLLLLLLLTSTDSARVSCLVHRIYYILLLLLLLLWVSDPDPDATSTAAISQLVPNKLGKFLIGSPVSHYVYGKCKEQQQGWRRWRSCRRSWGINGTANVLIPISRRYGRHESTTGLIR